MPRMTARKRVTTALAHQEPDRVPFDCTFTYDAYSQLERAMGWPRDENIRAGGPALNVKPSIEFLETLGVDLYYIGLNPWKETPPFTNGMNLYTDIWGVGYEKVENGGRLEYPNTICPLADATIADLDDYDWPDPKAPELIQGLAERAQKLFDETEFALVGKFSSSIFEQAAALRGMERVYMDFVQNPAFIEALFTRLTDIAIGLVETGLQACGKYLQLVRLAGDDMGGQRGTLFSPKMFRSMIKPHFARLYGAAKAAFHTNNPEGKVMGHTDGDVYPIIADYIEFGLDVLNPVQPRSMDPIKLKNEFGDRLCFWGSIDEQFTLPFGTPADVQEEVIQRLKTLGKGGGLIIGPTHLVQIDTPLENFWAMVNTTQNTTYGSLSN